MTVLTVDGSAPEKRIVVCQFGVEALAGASDNGVGLGAGLSCCCCPCCEVLHFGKGSGSRDDVGHCAPEGR